MPSKKIGNYGKPWKIRHSRARLRNGQGQPAWGYADFSKREIVLRVSSKDHPVERDLVMHEVIHKLCPFLEEECVSEMATELDDVLDLMGL